MNTYTPDSTRVVHRIGVDLIQRPVPIPIHVVQHDDRLPILEVSLTKNGEPYAILSETGLNSRAKIRVGKPDGTFSYNDALGCSENRTTVYFEITKPMTEIADDILAVVEISYNTSGDWGSDTKILSSSPIVITVDRNPITHGMIESTVEYKELIDAVADANRYKNEAINSATAADNSASIASGYANAAEIYRSEALRYRDQANDALNNVKSSEVHVVEMEIHAQQLETLTKSHAEETKLYNDQAMETVTEFNTQKGSPNGLASLGSDGKVPAVQLPSYVDDVIDKVEALEEFVGTLPAVGTEATTVIGYVDEQVAKASGDATQVASDLAEEITRAKAAEKANADAITVLNGESTVTGSVKNTVSEAIAEVVAKAPEDFDTLKEIADYIASDKTKAAEIEADLSTLKGSEDTVGSVANAIKVSKAYADELDGAMNERVEALETTVGDAESGLVKDVAELKTAASTGVDGKIKTAIEGLDSTKSQVAGTDGLALEIVEEDGKIVSISGSIIENTYDVYGTAQTVQNDLNNYKYELASIADIDKLFL